MVNVFGAINISEMTDWFDGLGQLQIRALIAQKKKEIEQRKQMIAGVSTPAPQGARAGGLTTPAPHGMATPTPTGFKTPMPHGMTTPMPTGFQTPMPAGGIATPAPHGLTGATTPLPGEHRLHRFHVIWTVLLRGCSSLDNTSAHLSVFFVLLLFPPSFSLPVSFFFFFFFG